MLIARHFFFQVNRKNAKSKHIIYEVLREGTETTYQWTEYFRLNYEHSMEYALCTPYVERTYGVHRVRQLGRPCYTRGPGVNTPNLIAWLASDAILLLID